MRFRLIAFAAAAAAALAAVVSCSLGLDEALIDAREAGVEPDTGVTDSGADVLPPSPEGGTCTRNEECMTTHGCLQGRCDLSRGACAYDVCRPTACSTAACNVATQQCGAPAAYKYRAGSFLVGTPVSRVVAVHPWLVVLTNNGSGPLAFNVSNPAATTPTPVPIAGLGFIPAQMVGSGSRVYFLGNLTGPGPTRLPIAWIDMPADPFAPRLEAKSVLATYSRTEPASAIGRGEDSIMLVGPGGATNHPSSIVQAPLAEPLTITATTIVFTAGSAPIGVSGSRLVMRQISPQSQATFGFVPGAGTMSPGAQQDTILGDAGFVGGAEQFATLANGSLYWSVNSLTAPATPGPANARALRGFFLVADGNSSFDPLAGVDIELYNTGPAIGGGASLAGPVAMVDPKSVIVSAAARENTAQTSVQFLNREPLEIVKDPDGGVVKRTVLGFPIGALVGAAASNGVGYIVANDPAMNATVFVFDPKCPL